MATALLELPLALEAYVRHSWPWSPAEVRDRSRGELTGSRDHQRRASGATAARDRSAALVQTRARPPSVSRPRRHARCPPPRIPAARRATERRSAPLRPSARRSLLRRAAHSFGAPLPPSAVPARRRGARRESVPSPDARVRGHARWWRPPHDAHLTRERRTTARARPPVIARPAPFGRRGCFRRCGGAARRASSASSRPRSRPPPSSRTVGGGSSARRWRARSPRSASSRRVRRRGRCAAAVAVARRERGARACATPGGARATSCVERACARDTADAGRGVEEAGGRTHESARPAFHPSHGD